MVETNPGKTMTGAGAHAKSAVQALLSLERAQKLDLLNHLITNLRQSLVVCGPEGIGKTTLLENLTASKSDSWIVYSNKANAQISFEQAQADLLQFLQQSDHAFVGQNLEQILNTAETNNQKIVFLIDDAGLLAPGLMGSLCQFASAYAALRVVFALTADELHVKNSSDKAVDDCHFIDIPALTEQQCGDFLKNLSSKPGAIISTENLNSAMIGKLYRETHGIPGKIVNIQKGQVKAAQLSNWQWISAAAAILIAVAISFFLWDEDADKPERAKQQVEQNLTKQQAEVVVEKAVPYSPIIEDTETKLPIDPDVVSIDIEPPVVEKSEQMAETFSEIIDVAKNEINGAGSDPFEPRRLHREPVKEAASEPGNDDLITDGSDAQDQVVTTPPADMDNDNDEISKESAGAIDESVVVGLAADQARQAKESQKTLTKETATEKTLAGNSRIQDQVVTSPLETTNVDKPIKNVPAAVVDKKAVISAPVDQAVAKEIPKTLVKPAPIEKLEKKPTKVVKAKPKKSIEQKSAKQAAKKSQAKSGSRQGTNWVLNQKASHYTLQLMAISRQRKAALLNTIEKHSSLQDQLHIFETIKKGEEKYVLLYGSFSTLAEVKQAKKNLPKAFAKPWLRSFKVLHKQIKSNQ